MDKVHGADLDQLDNKTIDEDRLYDEYLQIVAEVLPSVDAWYSTFTSALPMAEDAWEKLTIITPIEELVLICERLLSQITS